MKNLIIQEGNYTPYLKLCKNGIFRNHAIILDSNYKWELYDNNGYYILKPIGVYLHENYKDLFIFENDANGFFTADCDGGFYIGSLYSERDYKLSIFKYKRHLLLTFEYEFQD